MITVLQDKNMTEWEKGYTYVNFRNAGSAPAIIFCTMHQQENCNNLEIFKLALYCRKTGTKLVMFGQRNHFPLFSTFADAMIFPNDHNGIERIYDDAEDRQDITTYEPSTPPAGLRKDIVNLSMYNYVDHGGKRPTILIDAMEQITDDEVVQNFTSIEVFVLQRSVEVYDTLRANLLIHPGQIICELKEHTVCHGPRFRHIAMRVGVETGLPFMANRGELKALATLAGQDYMAVQCLASDILKWAWVCDGGSANIFSFLPYKILAIRDVFVPEGLLWSLHQARYGHNSFPFFSTEAFFQRLPEDTYLQQQIREYIR